MVTNFFKLVLGIVNNVTSMVTVAFVPIVTFVLIVIRVSITGIYFIMVTNNAVMITIAGLMIFMARVTGAVIITASGTLTLTVQTDASPDLGVNLCWLVAVICDTVDFSCLRTDILEIGLCFPNQYTVPCEHNITIFPFAEVKLRRSTWPLVVLNLRYAS